MANGFFWKAVLLHCREISEHQEMCSPVLLACFSGFRFFWRVGLLPDRKIFGTSGDVPSDLSPNEFGALKFRHQLLA